MSSEHATADPKPRHIAIVMDGNGRWATRRHRPRSFGHRAGQKALRATVECCLREGIAQLTLFAFSSENWKRPSEEVDALMDLFLGALDREVDELHGHGVCIRFVGALDAFSAALRTRMRAAMDKTAANTRLVTNICVNYGGRWDITRAARALAQAARDGVLQPEEISEAVLDRHMCLAGGPPPDLLIRTGGEQRISNFLLWQLAYTELHFTDTLWPDFTADDLRAAIADFACRQRRYGATPEQVAS